jgi:hypothetical protein
VGSLVIVSPNVKKNKMIDRSSGVNVSMTRLTLSVFRCMKIDPIRKIFARVIPTIDSALMLGGRK